MQFYKFEGIITNPDWTEENDKRHILRERARKICLKTTSFNQTLKGQSCFYVTDASDNIFHAGIISQESSGTDTGLFKSTESFCKGSPYGRNYV